MDYKVRKISKLRLVQNQSKNVKYNLISIHSTLLLLCMYIFYELLIFKDAFIIIFYLLFLYIIFVSFSFPGAALPAGKRPLLHLSPGRRHGGAALEGAARLRVAPRIQHQCPGHWWWQPSPLLRHAPHHLGEWWWWFNFLIK